MKAQKTVDVSVSSFFNLGNKWGGWSASLPGRFTPGNDRLPICIESWMDPRTDLDSCGKSHPPTGIRYPDIPVRSESLYRPHYPISLPKGKLIISTPRCYTHGILETAYIEHLESDVEVLATYCVIMTQIQSVIIWLVKTEHFCSKYYHVICYHNRHK
jgi:hypothetical protein